MSLLNKAAFALILPFTAGIAIAAETPGAAPQDKVAAQPGPATIDSNSDGKADAWDRDGNGAADAWDTNADGKPDQYDTDGDGKPDSARPTR